MATIALEAFDYALLEALPALQIHCRTIVKGSSVDAEDLVQDAILAALDRRDTLDLSGNIAGWLKYAARNRYFDIVRRGRAHSVKPGARDDQLRVSVECVGDCSSVVVPMPAPQLTHLEAVEAIEAIDTLSPKLREAMDDIIDEATTEESAMKRRIPVATVRTRRCRARDAMREQFGLPKLMAAS